MRRAMLAAVAAAVGILAAGCGGTASTGTALPASANGAAAVLPADTVALVAASTDVPSSDWHAFGDAFLKRFEQHTKLSWTDDVRPALGDELDVAVLPGKQVVALTQPQDAGKLAALLKQADAKLVTRTVGGWTAIADSQSALDAVAGATTTLAQSNLFEAAMATLPTDVLARAYANGAEAQTLLPSMPSLPATGAGVEWAAAAVTSSADGLKLAGVVHPSASTTATPPAPRVSTLVDEIPAGALFVADLQAPERALALLPTLPAQLGKVLGGETALYVRPGSPLPEVTLVTHPADPAAAAQALDGLLRSLPRQAPTLQHATIDGELVVSTTQQGIADFRGGGAKLSSDATFQEARKASGMPAATTGFVYANVKDALPLLRLAGPALGLKLPDDAALDTLRTLTAFGSQNGGNSTFTVFLGTGSS